MEKTAIGLLAGLAVAALSPTLAAQSELDSTYVGQDEPAIDAIFDEWEGDAEYSHQVTFTTLGEEDRVGGTGSYDGEDDVTVEYALVHNDNGLFAALKVRDQRFVRAEKLTTTEDHVELWFALPPRNSGKKLDVYGVGVYADPTRPDDPVQVLWLKRGARRPGKPVVGAVAAVRGDKYEYTIELGIPWAALRAADSSRRSGMRAALYKIDCDMASKLSEKSVLGTAPVAGRGDGGALPPFALEDLAVALTSFLDQQECTEVSPKHQATVDIAGGKEKEQLLIIDRYVMAHSGDTGGAGAYIYRKLPVEGSDQIASFQLKDVAGSRQPEIVLEFTEDNPDNSRRWVSVYTVTAELVFEELFTAALRVESGEVLIENKYKFVKGKGRTKKAILVTPGEVRGVDESTIGANVPEEGGNPMVLPWDDPPKKKYEIQDGRYHAK